MSTRRVGNLINVSFPLPQPPNTPVATFNILPPFVPPGYFDAVEALPENQLRQSPSDYRRSTPYSSFGLGDTIEAVPASSLYNDEFDFESDDFAIEDTDRCDYNCG